MKPGFCDGQNKAVMNMAISSKLYFQLSVLCTRDLVLERYRLGRGDLCACFISHSITPDQAPCFCFLSLLRMHCPLDPITIHGEPGGVRYVIWDVMRILNITRGKYSVMVTDVQTCLMGVQYSLQNQTRSSQTTKRALKRRAVSHWSMRPTMMPATITTNSTNNNNNNDTRVLD